MSNIFTEIKMAKKPCIYNRPGQPGDIYTPPLVQGGVYIYLGGGLATRRATERKNDHEHEH